MRGYLVSKKALLNLFARTTNPDFFKKIIFKVLYRSPFGEPLEGLLVSKAQADDQPRLKYPHGEVFYRRSLCVPVSEPPAKCCFPQFNEILDPAPDGLVLLPPPQIPP